MMTIFVGSVGMLLFLGAVFVLWVIPGAVKMTAIARFSASMRHPADVLFRPKILASAQGADRASFKPLNRNYENSGRQPPS
jgi:formate hydrogenlyase subunit 3/multisubunit Na+/H+ antiporter MnhD subunit